MEHNPLFLFYWRCLGKIKPALIQETVADDPWKLLVAVILLNKTNGKAAIPLFWSLLQLWPTPSLLSQADEAELTSLLYHLGIQSVRAKRLINLSFNYLYDPPSEYNPRRSRHKMAYTRQEYPPTPIAHLPGAGPYALDSYRIFCSTRFPPTLEEWKDVRPTDKQLIRYLKWKWAYEEHKEWSPEEGVLGPLSIPYLQSLVHALSPLNDESERKPQRSKRAQSTTCHGSGSGQTVEIKRRFHLMPIAMTKIHATW